MSNKVYARTFHVKGNSLTSVHKSQKEADDFIHRELDMWEDEENYLIGGSSCIEKEGLMTIEQFKHIYGIE